MGNINISTAKTKAYANKQRTMNSERYSKQTQSNPITGLLIQSGRASLSAPRQRNSQFSLYDNLLPFCVEVCRLAFPQAEHAHLQRRLHVVRQVHCAQRLRLAGPAAIEEFLPVCTQHRHWDRPAAHDDPYSSLRRRNSLHAAPSGGDTRRTRRLSLSALSPRF